MKTDSKLFKLTSAGLMAALIFVITFAVRIPMPGGYVNIGDVPVYMGAYLLGGPAGAVAAAVGSALADLIGFPAYTIPTLIIKGLMGLVCGLIMKNKGFVAFILAAVLGGLIMVAGYAVFEILFFNINMAIADLGGNSIQWVVGVIVAAAFYPGIRKVALILKLRNGESLH